MGLLDLFVQNIDEGELYSPGGEWEYIYGRHIDPGESPADRIHDEAELIKVQSAWKGISIMGKSFPESKLALIDFES